MEKKTFKVESVFSGERIDKVIPSYFPELTRSYVKTLIDDGCVLVNGKTVKANHKTTEGNEVEINLPATQTLDVLPENIPLSIVYEDDCLLVINKPADMVVHPADGNFTGTLVNALLYYCGDTLSGINGVKRPGIVHRLDKDTTGLLVVAKNDSAHKNLSEQLKTRTLKRHYYTIVHGNIKEDSGTVKTFIARNPADRKKMAVSHDSSDREAITDFEVCERFKKYTLVKCSLQTGRTHQIRVHMKHIGHPVLGDKTYGIKKEEFNLEGQLLHAGEIGFIHPESEEYMEFSAPLPVEFEKILNNLRKRQK